MCFYVPFTDNVFLFSHSKSKSMKNKAKNTAKGNIHSFPLVCEEIKKWWWKTNKGELEGNPSQKKTKTKEEGKIMFNGNISQSKKTWEKGEVIGWMIDWSESFYRETE